MCYIALNSSGGFAAYSLLGYTDHGVKVRVIRNYSDIITDIFGPMTPHDIQDMGMVANISVPLIASDRTVLNSIQSIGDQTAGTAGLLSTPGLVIGASFKNFKVAIASPADSPWIFPYCITRPGFDTELATRANPFTLEFFGWPWRSVTTVAAKDSPLWVRTPAPS